MTANKTTEILQQQIDKLNQEQTETKWNEKDKKLFEKFLGLVHDDPFRIFYADGSEVHRILELVYPDSVKGRIEELYRIKYIYDGFLKFGDVVKPQIEIERPNLETLIKDISDHYLEVYRNQHKVKENRIKKCRMILEKTNRNHYITMDDCSLVLDIADHSERTLDEKVLVLSEILKNNNSAIGELLKAETMKKIVKTEKNSKRVKEEELEPKISMKEESPIVSMIEPAIEEEEIPEPIVPMIEEEETGDYVVDDFYEEFPKEKITKTDIPEIDELMEMPTTKREEKEVQLPRKEEFEEYSEEDNIVMEDTSLEEEESYIEQYLHALEEIDPTDISTIHYALPKCHMPNFTEIMNSLIETLEKQIAQIKEEEQNSEVKRVRVLREELGRAQQLLKTIVNYLDKQEKKDNEKKERIVEGEEIQLLLLENEAGESLIERDFRKQLEESQYGIAMELLRNIERFSDLNFRAKAKSSAVSGILEITEGGVHVFFEPFAENTYIVIALLAEKNGYSSWVQDKLRLRHCLFQKQEKEMQRRWNQHGTRNTMLLGSETAYLEMQDMAEKR